MAVRHSTAASPAGLHRRLPQEVAAEGDQAWKGLTEKANRAFSQNDAATARTLYLEALSEAETLFDAAVHGQCSLPVAVIFNISCHNIAELEERQENQTTAATFFKKAYARLSEAAGSPETPLPLRLDCAQHLKHALGVLIQHHRKVGTAAHDIDAVISEARGIALRVFHVARHAKIADASCTHCKIRTS